MIWYDVVFTNGDDGAPAGLKVQVQRFTKFTLLGALRIMVLGGFCCSSH